MSRFDLYRPRLRIGGNLYEFVDANDDVLEVTERTKVFSSILSLLVSPAELYDSFLQQKGWSVKSDPSLSSVDQCL